jgi:hypothetical protein
MLPEYSGGLTGLCHEIFSFRFFYFNHLPQGLKITLGSFHTFLKIRGDIPNSRRTTNSMTPAVNLPPVLLVFVAPGGKFATGVNDTAAFWEQYQTAYTLKHKIIKRKNGKQK